MGVVPTTIYSTVVQQSVVSRPGQTRISTVTRTVVRTEQLPGQQQTVFNTRYVTNTNYVTSTIANNQFSTVVVTSTVQPQCSSGYNYPEPQQGFNPFQG